MPGLSRLLERARRARPGSRIELRSDIAAHGIPALNAMLDWIGDPKLERFAVRVIGAVGYSGERDSAIRALVPLLDREGLRSDVMEQLTRLGWTASKQPVARLRRADIHEVPPIPIAAGLSWPGFQKHEFGQVARTEWRSADGERSLAPIVTRQLRSQHDHFESHGVERAPQIHFAVSERYRWGGDRKSGFRAAKLVIYAHGPAGHEEDLHVLAGLYVEKGDGGQAFGPVDDGWDWPWFVRALERHDFQESLKEVMERHALTLGDYLGQNFFVTESVGGIGRIEDDEFVFRDANGVEQARGFRRLADVLRGLPADRWHNLHIGRKWPAEEAMANGQAFAFNALLPVLEDLARVYLQFLQDAMPRGGANYRIVERDALAKPRQLQFAVHAHSDAGHFTVPRPVLDELGIEDDGQIHLEVDGDRGRYYAGTMRLASGTEVYCRLRDQDTRGLEQIRPDELLRVTASRPAAGGS